MSKEITLAIISAFVGATGAIVAWLQAARTSRLKAEADAALERIKSETGLAIENMKADRELRKRAFEIAIEESKPVEAALARVWHDLQTIKDVTSRYLSGYQFDEASAMKSVRLACQSISENYATWGTAVPQSARDAWHKAKASASSVEALLESRGHTPELAQDLTQRLSETRIILSDYQMVIASARHAVRDMLLKRVLELG